MTLQWWQLALAVLIVVLIIAWQKTERFTKLPFGMWEGPVPDPTQATYWEEAGLTHGNGAPLRFTKRGRGRFDDDPYDGKFQSSLTFNKLGEGTYSTNPDSGYDSTHLDPPVEGEPGFAEENDNTWEPKANPTFVEKNYGEDKKKEGLTPMASILMEDEPFTDYSTENISFGSVAKAVNKEAKKAGKDIKKGAKKAGKDIEKGAKKAGKEIEKGAKKGLKELEKGAKAVGKELEKGAKGITGGFMDQIKKYAAIAGGLGLVAFMIL